MELLPTLTAPLAQEKDAPCTHPPFTAVEPTTVPKLAPIRPPATGLNDEVPFAVEVTTPVARPLVMVAPALFWPIRPPIETPNPVALTALPALRFESEALLSPI